MNTPTPNFYLNFIYHAQRLADRVKAVRHHPQNNSPRCFPHFHPLLLTSPPLLDRQTKPSLVSPAFGALLLSFLLLEVQGLALFNRRNNRQGSPAGGSTDFSAGCLKHVKRRLDMCSGCVCVRVCGRRPVASSFQFWERILSTGIGWWDQGIIILKDVLIMLYFKISKKHLQIFF